MTGPISITKAQRQHATANVDTFLQLVIACPCSAHRTAGEILHICKFFLEFFFCVATLLDLNYNGQKSDVTMMETNGRIN